MASSGNFTINAWSVDNGHGDHNYWYCGSLPSGTCYNPSNAGAFNRGHVQANITLSYNVDDSGNLTIGYVDTAYINGPWYVCSVNGYNIDIDFSVDGNNWTNVMHADKNDWPTCVADNSHKVGNIASILTGMLGSATLTQSGYIRARMWTANACPTCGGIPTQEVWPNAFPNDAASAATAVPVYIDVSWTATINYNANGGTGAPSATTLTTTGDSVVLVLSNTSPTRTNYRFEGWATSPSATMPQYQPGDNFTVQKSDPTKTLYAVWRKYYHPGKVWNGSDWLSHDREPGGDARVKSASSWKDMRTIDAPTGKNDPPSIYHDNDWYNMRDIGTH